MIIILIILILCQTYGKTTRNLKLSKSKRSWQSILILAPLYKIIYFIIYYNNRMDERVIEVFTIVGTIFIGWFIFILINNHEYKKAWKTRKDFK